ADSHAPGHEPSVGREARHDPRRRRLAAVAHGVAQSGDRGGAVRGVIHVGCSSRARRLKRRRNKQGISDSRPLAYGGRAASIRIGRTGGTFSTYSTSADRLQAAPMAALLPAIRAGCGIFAWKWRGKAPPAPHTLFVPPH